MIPFIIGGVALAATGYGLDKYLNNCEGTDYVKDKVHYALLEGSGVFDHKEEALGTNEMQISREDINETPSYMLSFGKKEFFKEDFDLYIYKENIRNEFKEKYNINLCSKEDIKKDIVTSKFAKEYIKDFASILEALKMQSIKYNNEDKYIKVLKKLLTKKLIKNDTANHKIYKPILEANTLVNDNSLYMSATLFVQNNKLLQNILKMTNFIIKNEN